MYKVIDIPAIIGTMLYNKIEKNEVSFLDISEIEESIHHEDMFIRIDASQSSLSRVIDLSGGKIHMKNDNIVISNSKSLRTKFLCSFYSMDSHSRDILEGVINKHYNNVK